MGENSISVADALALRNSGNNGNNDSFLGGGQGAWWVIILILFFAFAGFGNGGRNGGHEGNTVVIPSGFGGYGSSATQQSVSEAFNFNQLDNGIRAIQNGLCDGFYTTSLNIANLGSQMQNCCCEQKTATMQGFNAMQNIANQNTNSLQNTMFSGFTGINDSIKDCCCETREAIMQSNFNNQAAFNAAQNQLSACGCELSRGQENLKYALAQATCEITTNADKNTDRIINHLVKNEMDTLRNELQSAQFQLSQNAQTNSIINQLLPVARPAYITYSPYATPSTTN